MGVLKRIISVLIIMVVMVVILSISNSVQALTLSEMSGKISTFKSNGTTTISTGEITTQFADLARILTTIGAGVLVIVITYMGIKYFISSPEEQAKLKGQLIGVVVSAVVIFGAVSIWELAINIFKGM